MAFFALSHIISPSLSPNTESDDVFLAFKTLVSPGGWQKGSAIARVSQWFRRFFPDHEVVLFNSGRSAELAILQSFDIGRGDEVLIQAFTCVAVPNSVLWAGAKPVFVDIDKTLNLDPDDAEKKISSKTRALIVQHTFGVAANMEALVKLAQKHYLILIEDCAHSLGARYLPVGKAGQGQKVGTFGEAAFFSFGRDKVVSSVFGGAAIIKSNLKSQISNLKQYQEKLPYPSYFWIFQQLLHPIAFSIILLLYDVIIGKTLLVLLQKLHLLSFPVYKEEKLGLKPDDFPTRFPNALATLLVKQLDKFERFSQNRREVALYYRQSIEKSKKIGLLPDVNGAIYLRFPLFSENPELIRKKAKNQGILLGNWYHHVVDPKGVNFEKIGYEPGSCPRAEKAASQIINLPTRITEKDARKVVRVLSET